MFWVEHDGDAQSHLQVNSKLPNKVTLGQFWYVAASPPNHEGEGARLTDVE